jgi:hypothetical protein
MGISSIEDVLPYVKSNKLKDYLAGCKSEHEKLEREIEDRLQRFHDDGKKPNIMAKTMSELKTNFKLGATLLNRFGISSLKKTANSVKN